MTEPWLYLSRMIVNGEPRVYVDDAHAPSSSFLYGSCRRLGHDPAWRTPAQRAAIRGSGADSRMALSLDCPCDVPCPRCESPAGWYCTTLDGGGTSGGGFRTRWHAVRVKASPLCQAVLAGERSSCDWGLHPWAPDGDGGARCQACPERAPLHDAAGAYEERRRFEAARFAAEREAAQRDAGVTRLSDYRAARA